jgi:hypothetical protein
MMATKGVTAWCALRGNLLAIGVLLAVTVTGPEQGMAQTLAQTTNGAFPNGASSGDGT